LSGSSALHPAASQYLCDLLDHLGAADRLVSRGHDAYQADEMLRFAAEDLLIRIGEIAGRLHRSCPQLAEKCPELALRRLIDVRNLVAHGYSIVDPEQLWSILEVNLPAVRAAAALAGECMGVFDSSARPQVDPVSGFPTISINRPITTAEIADMIDED